MASRRERADALRQFTVQLRAFQDQTLIGLQRLRLDLIYAGIDEEDRATYSPEFESAACVLTTALEVTFEAQRLRLGALAQALDTLNSDADPSGKSGPASGAPSGSATNARTHAIGGGFTGETIEHGKETFDVWSFVDLDPTCIDWGADADFPQKFSTEMWKGRNADDYRELMRKTPALLAQCRTSGTGGVAEDLALARDAYFGSDRVRLEIGVDGRVLVVNGRHRVMAAIECGASIPVSAWRAKGFDTPKGESESPGWRPARGPDFREESSPSDQERRETRGRRLR